MTIQQLEYIVAVDNFRHFAKAAEVCFVTQPTLSMMIQKLEEEMDVKIFDRTKHPVEPTHIGAQMIAQARISLKHLQQIKEIVENEKSIVKGKFQLGIIPTVATYLVPELLQQHLAAHNDIELILQERTTENIIKEIMNGTLDGGVLAGPVNRSELVEYPVYYEKFYAYVSPHDSAYKKRKINLDEIDINNIWLLENEHCFRGQIEHLCMRKRKSSSKLPSIRYESGSIETLINVVDYNPGITIIPEMHAMALNEDRQENLREFENLTAVREVCVAVSKEYARKTMLKIIIDVIRNSVPKSMQNPELKQYVVPL
ncbi:MAG: hydrogen peroxide-inducible genes activator [Prevotellaceae bacterium]|jgi:LysR family hydrogen peroxide-inducible transcriptional activator|nr:hydrogen peroxide-inducible genes activator [Prevotellaceae bacterium]